MTPILINPNMKMGSEVRLNGLSVLWGKTSPFCPFFSGEGHINCRPTFLCDCSGESLIIILYIC